MLRKMVALLVVALLVNSIVLTSSWAFPAENATEAMEPTHHMVVDSSLSEHCETEQADFSCWSHCTLAQSALSKFGFPALLTLSIDANPTQLMGQTSKPISPHWRPPIFLS